MKSSEMTETEARRRSYIFARKDVLIESVSKLDKHGLELVAI